MLRKLKLYGELATFIGHKEFLDAVNFTGGTNPYGTPDPTAEYAKEIYKIDRKSAENRAVVQFELAAAFDLANIRIPLKIYPVG